mmetsp:Transcript_22083/g.42145  ORF Transcript_22083/g.42145 Transcript_22083/m.42145 type:complete len:331 (+) Transcript_22083:375-1367(+)
MNLQNYVAGCTAASHIAGPSCRMNNKSNPRAPQILPINLPYFPRFRYVGSRAAHVESFSRAHTLPANMPMNLQGGLGKLLEAVGNSTASRHLVLNFDVNKTIVMVDSVTGKSMEDIVNAILAGAVWGLVEHGGVWRCSVDEPSIHRPEEGLVSYYDYLEARLPGKENKKQRDDLSAVFTEPGEPGHALRSYFDDLMNALLLPEHVRGTDAARDVGLHGDSVFIIPAFFQLLIKLKAERRSFSVIFRTFGKEMEEVVLEFNSFCEGRHPMYPGVVFDGSDGAPDMRASLEACSKFDHGYHHVGIKVCSLKPNSACARAACESHTCNVNLHN